MPATVPVTTATAPGADRPDVSRSASPRIAIPLDEAGLALRGAWASYLVLALVPPAAMIGSIFFLLFTGNDRTFTDDPQGFDFFGMAWLVAGMIYIGIALPVSYYVRRLCWIDFYKGGVVDPKDYLKGWLAVWIPLVIGGVLGFVGLALTAEFATVFISMLSFVVFLSTTPNGHALTRPVGDVDDPGTYEEPK